MLYYIYIYIAIIITLAGAIMRVAIDFITDMIEEQIY